MQKSSVFLCLMLYLCFSQCTINGAIINPVERSVGKLNISIDPRMEILAAIHSLSSNADLSNRNLPYSGEILNYFESFSSHEAVNFTESLLQNYGFSYDAPVAFMLHLSQPSELERNVVFSEYILKRSGEGDNLEQYRKAIKQFADASNFEAFWNSKIPFYNQILDMTVAEIGRMGIDFVKMMEDYFNETQDSYNVIITPAFYGGKGVFVSNLNDKDVFYACLSTTNMRDGIPYLNANNLLFYIWHEYGHFFVNPLTENYSDRVASVATLFEPIKSFMSEQTYVNWETCVNEHIIRAVNIRLVEMLDPNQSKALLENELRNRFVYIEPLVEKLKDFENNRDKSKITFSEFFPELLNVLDSLHNMEYWKQVDINFRGPINAVIQGNERLTVIFPTQDIDTDALKIAQDYASFIFDRFIEPRGGILLADTTALKTDLSDFGIWAYGTIESNLFLKEYAADFPFRIENQTIYADKEYTEKESKFISCVPNPLNSEKGMVIYTALSNNAIQGINDVFHGNEDYILFLNRETIIIRGFYNKNEKWTF